MSHEIKTHAGNRVWGLLVSDGSDEIQEEDIRAIEQEAAALDPERLLRAWLTHGDSDHSSDDYDAPTLDCAQRVAAEYNGAILDALASEPDR